MAAKLLIADSQPIARAGLRLALERTGAYYDISEAGSASHLLSRILAGDCGILLLDMNLPGSCGLDLLCKVIGAPRHPKVVAMGGEAEERRYAVEAIRLGCSGFLSKQDSEDSIALCVGLVASGRRYITHRVAEMLASAMVSAPFPHKTLSKRERQVFDRLAAGNSTGEIAAHLGIGVRTISTYRTRIMEKMSLKTNAELTAYAVRNKLPLPPRGQA